MSVAITLPPASIQHRKAFHSAYKQTNETIDDWFHRLQDLAQPCNYGCYLEMLLLDKLVVGLDAMIIDRLCNEQKDLSLRNVLEFTRNYEVNIEPIDIKPEMVIVKQELELSDVEQDDESQSNYEVNYTDGGIDGQIDAPFPVKTFANTQQTLVYDRPKAFECYLCHKLWPTVGHLTYHFGRHHTMGTISKCQFCGKWLKTPSSLVRHVNMHLSDRPYHCDLCDFSFASAISLKRHMIQHNESKSNPFKCSQCQKEFISRRHLRLHRKTHESNHNVDDDDIIEHLQRQLGEMEVPIVKIDGVFSFKCDICDKYVKAASQKRGKDDWINWQAQPYVRHLKTKRHLKCLQTKIMLKKRNGNEFIYE